MKWKQHLVWIWIVLQCLGIVLGQNKGTEEAKAKLSADSKVQGTTETKGTAKETSPPEVSSPPEEKYRTPRAGERIQGTFPLFGFELDIPARDRTKVTAINLGLATYLPKVGDDTFIPFGAFYHFNTWEENRRRFRAILVGVVNYIDFYEGSWNDYGIEFLASWENYTLPIPSSLVIEGVELEDSKIYWGYLRGGLGLGWRAQIYPWQFDNTFSLALYYEPGLLYFDDTKDTAKNYIVPSMTYEERIHARLRFDALERNIMELMHTGWAGGIDVIWGHRHKWKDHDYNGSFKEDDTQTYWLLSAYVKWAGGPDFLSERHRFIFAMHGAFSPDDGLDRYSAFKIGGGPSGDEAAELARLPIPGMKFDEFIVSRYFLGYLEYRFELLFFIYLHIKGTLGVLRRMELDDDKREVSLSKNELVGSVGIAMTMGLPWDSQIYLEYVSDRGLVRGEERKYGHNILISWSKSF